MAKSRDFKFCTMVDHVKYEPRDDKSSTSGHGHDRDKFQILGPKSYLWND